MISPPGVVRPSALADHSVNHRAPSGPVVMSHGPLPAVGTGNSVTAPDGVIRPILLAANSVNHTLPSGPHVMPNSEASAVATGCSTMGPVVARAGASSDS